MSPAEPPTSSPPQQQRQLRLEQARLWMCQSASTKSPCGQLNHPLALIFICEWAALGFQALPYRLPASTSTTQLHRARMQPEPRQAKEVFCSADGTALEPGQTGSASAAEQHLSAKPPPTDLASAGSEPGDGADSKRAREEGSRPASPVRMGVLHGAQASFGVFIRVSLGLGLGMQPSQCSDRPSCAQQSTRKCAAM